MVKIKNLLVPLEVSHAEILDNVRRVIAECGQAVYLVGGPVRDLMLGRPVKELDLAVGGDAAGFARELARLLKARVRSFPRFLTFKLLLPSGEAIDVATTRAEIYGRPGALPSVTPADLRADLARRDFSINAIAADLLSGDVHDPMRGRADLRAKQIRILHPRSFLDDPTRVLRALRFSARLGFSFERSTQARLREAITEGAMQSVSAERRWREIFFAFDEADAAAALKRTLESGAVADLLPRTDLPQSLQKLIGRLNDDPGSFDRHVAILSILAEEPLTGIPGMAKKDLENIRTILREGKAFGQMLIKAPPSQRMALCRGRSREFLAVVQAADRTASAVIRDYLGAKEVSLPFRGDQLQVDAGLHIGRALDQTREALREGKITERQALSFARRKALEYLKSSKQTGEK